MKRVDLEGVAVNMIAYGDLLEAKRRSDRPRDHADVEELERTENEGGE